VWRRLPVAWLSDGRLVLGIVAAVRAQYVFLPPRATESISCDHLEVIKISGLLANLVAEFHWIRLRHDVRDECAGMILSRAARQKNDQAVFVYRLQRISYACVVTEIRLPPTVAKVGVKYFAGSMLELRRSLRFRDVNNVTRSAGGKLL
jgi:hypothetical protein